MGGVSGIGGVGGSGDSATSEEAASETAPPKPGVYGDQFNLQIDLSRLPRVEEFQALESGQSNVSDIPSDIKTVSWYLAEGDSSATQRSVLDGAGSASGGLIRREMDRAVTSYANYAGTVDSLASGEQLIAPEVTSLEFRYFDGAEWLTEWDMEEKKGLPMAVEITIAIRPLVSDNEAQASGQPQAVDDGSNDMLYRTVVHLPSARPAEETAEDESSGAATSDSSTAAGGSTAP